VTAAERVVAALDLAAKVRLLSGRGFWVLESVPEAGLGGIVVSDGPHGLRCQADAGDHLGLAPAVPATCFPPAVLLGSTWDEDLAHRIGAAIGHEARAQGVSVVLGPGLNLKRHPAGGRCFEYYAEDPVLGGRLAAANVRGIQSQGVGASVKHFAVNNQESHRLVVDAVVDERTLRELYLAGFEEVVTSARPWTVMSSYNRINGTYASDNVELLTTVLRGEWGFDGLVLSDWGGTNDRVAGVRAGMDLEMPGSEGAFDAEVLAAVADGSLDELAVDRCATRVVELLQRGQQTGERPTADHEAHHRLARQAAAAGSVLLTNDGVLPLRAAGRIAVVGAFATEPRYQGAGSSQVVPVTLDAALPELTARVGGAVTVVHAPGYDARTGRATAEQIAEAVAVARDADVVVCFAGLAAAEESEGFDRTTLDLSGDQVTLIEALAAAPTPVVVVLNNGGVVHLPWADRVNAVLECWLGGQAGGGAAVDVLFGDAEPGGRLAESIPFHIGQVPADRNLPGHARQVQYREGLYVGYRFHDRAGVPARFPFGFGLSYTSFAWTDVHVTGEGTDLVVHVTVTNTGMRAGSDVVQLYVRDVASSVPRPDKELKGFAKVHLDAGAHETVSITLGRRSFAVWDVDAHDWLVEAGRFELVVARSSVDVVEVLPVDVASDDRLGPDPRPVAREATEAEFAAMLRRPVPEPDPVRPFHRNSTLEDLESTAVGRVLAGVVVREGLKRAAHEFPDPDDATVRMIRSSIREGPVRSLAIMSGGLVHLAHVDALLDALNGRWGSVRRSVTRAVTGAVTGACTAAGRGGSRGAKPPGA
jgi:beta-glucosidase